MKRLLSILLILTLSLSVLTACVYNPGGSTDTDGKDPAGNTPDVTVRLGGLKGPTTMGMVKFLSDNEAGLTENKYEFTLAAAADELTPKLAKGELDIVAVPANLASILYNNPNIDVQLLAINTLGVIYLVEKGGEVTSFEDLKGKTIYATGKGSTPEFALRYILSQNGIDPDKDVTLEFKTEPTEVVAALKQGVTTVAMLPQPYVTVAQGSVEGLRIAVDLTKAWDDLDNGSALLTGTLVVRREFAEAHPDVIQKFLKEYAASTAYANENVAETAVLVEQYGIVKAAVAEKALPYCNIVCITGADMKPLMSGYLGVLLAQAPASVGNAVPGDDFYYGAS